MYSSATALKVVAAVMAEVSRSMRSFPPKRNLNFQKFAAGGRDEKVRPTLVGYLPWFGSRLRNADYCITQWHLGLRNWGLR
jgi:hypothetical protein